MSLEKDDRRTVLTTENLYSGFPEGVALEILREGINIITAFVTRRYRGKPEKLVERWG